MSNRSNPKTSLFWSAVEQFGSQVLSLIMTIIIARLVTPSDYGLIAMLTIFMALSQVFINSGFSNYLIQNKDRDNTDLDTIFYLNVSIGLICYTLLFVFSGPIADFYNQPVLKGVIKAYSLVLIISSFTLVQRALIYINRQYKKLSIITLVSLIVAGSFTIYFAIIGWGVWALVAYNLIESGVSSLLIWLSSKWHPAMYFSKRRAIKAFSFGSKLLGANILSSSVSNLYTLIIGKIFQANELGYYNRGQSLAVVFPSNFANMLQKASYPFLCDNQNDIQRLKDVFIKYIRIACVVCFPIMMSLLCISEPLIIFLLTDKWLPAVQFLQILCVGTMFDPLMRLNSIILSVTGQPKYSLYSEIIKKSVLLIILFSTVSFGITWVTLGAALYPFFDLVIVSFFVKKIIPISFIDELKIMIPYIGLSVAALLVSYIIMIQFDYEIVKLLVSLVSYFIVYIGLLRICLPEQYNYLESNIRSIISYRNG